MKKRSTRPGDSRNHDRRFSDRQVAGGEDNDSLATREGRPVRLPLADDTAEEVSEEIGGKALAEGIAAGIDVLRPHLRAIFLGLAGLFFASLAWMWMNQQQEALKAKSWDDYMNAAVINPEDPAALADVVNQHPGTPAADWARLVQAEMALNEGTQLLFVDRDRATPRIQAAADGYTELLLRRTKGLLAERATFGLAKANESLGRIDEARNGYEAVAADYPEGALAPLARQRSKSLAGESAREWYEWFAAQKMTPPPAPPVEVPANPAAIAPQSE